MRELTFKEINDQLKELFGEEDNSCCIECIKAQCCDQCDFYESCAVSCFDWIMFPYYDVMEDRIIINDYHYY